MSRLIAFSILVLALTVGIVPTATAADSPEQVALAYLDAIRAEGLTAAPRFVHPDEVERFQTTLMPAFSGDSPIAEHLRVMVFAPDATVESIRTMSPVEFMLGFTAFSDSQIKEMNVSMGDVEVLGSIREGEVVHLLTRGTASAGDLKLTALEVVSVKPYEDTWRLLLSSRLEGVAHAIATQAAGSAP